ncbi:tRNA lysidine(34) synthetase TilS [Gemmobacter caeruleus]|uniref:tRNA lysidine(34) synthetase TilS n=1 Tax=Gemmobacter caeruleus TaxID=2595004 RepID=UPI0011EBE65D|nr:tRNA lysidine(34) synthetase TilS [Gemmobacter caeruleus]
MSDDALLDRVAQAIAKARPDPAAPLPLGVAVSGGGDSVALLHLLHRLPPRAGLALHVVTVDHGLRPESAAEAAGVAAFCAGLGLPHVTLQWHGPAPTGNLMDQARRARATLIADWARARGLYDVALGHTADDDAESFLMNLGRAAGLEGLSGMRPQWQDQGIRWHRPLLGVTRAELRAWLRRQGIGWIDDPGNDNDRFTRVKARRALAALAPLGITVDRLADSIAHLAAARGVVQAATHRAADCLTESAGALSVARADWVALPAELRRRLLVAMTLWMGGGGYPPRAAQVARLDLALDQGRDATLAGLRFRPRAGRIAITREARAAMGPVAPGGIWDHRWQVTGPFAPGQTIAALGASGLAQCADWRAHGPREALIVTPAVWQGARLIAAPLARPDPLWQAQLRPDFGMFILAH